MSKITGKLLLKQALNMSGYLTSISGQSKIGKTVLCEKVVGLDYLIEVSGSDFTKKDDLWTKIGTKAGMPVGVEIINSGDVGAAMKESYMITKESVIEYYKTREFVLLLDDFHYVDNTMQIFMAQQFKDAIRKGFKVIIVSLPHRSDDAIRTNADLQGRINIIDIEMWTKDELMEIPRAGFHDLGIEISEEVIGNLAKESLCSPHTNLSFEDLMERISSLVTDAEKPTPKSLKDYLKNLQEVLDLKDRSYKVIEWKDNILFIIEPLFLFFLRWGR